MFVSNNCHLLPLFIFIISLQNQSVDVTSCYMITRSFLKLLYKLPNFIYYNSLLNLLLSLATLEFLSSTHAIVMTLVHPLAANASTSQFSWQWERVKSDFSTNNSKQFNMLNVSRQTLIEANHYKTFVAFNCWLKQKDSSILNTKNC